MTTPPVKISHPRHPLVAAYQQAKYDRKRILAKHKHTAAEIMAHFDAHAISDEAVYEITARDTDGPNRYDEILLWRYVGPAEDCRHLLGQRGYISVRSADLRASSPTNDEGLKWGANTWQVVERMYPDLNDGDHYRILISGAYEAAPAIAVLLAIGAASEHLEWDTDETIANAALRLSLDGAWSLRGASCHHLVEGERERRVLTATMELLRQSGDPRNYARNFLDNRGAILAALAEQEIELGGQMLDTEQVAERARIATTTLTGYVTREQAPQPDTGRGTRKPKWHEVTVAAWLLTRRA
ncbi:hypothetical protein [Streptosporangium sp. CA-115845]|uniref:hypothetical protein n=1 Tax=Streptosporangium sp. CA-115845 TaxID=3240071 RepID=UPI003D92F5C4